MKKVLLAVIGLGTLGYSVWSTNSPCCATADDCCVAEWCCDEDPCCADERICIVEANA